MKKIIFLFVLGLFLISSCVKVYYASEKPKDAKKTGSVSLSNITESITNKTCRFYVCGLPKATPMKGHCLLNETFFAKYNIDWRVTITCNNVERCYQILKSNFNVIEEDLQKAKSLNYVQCTVNEIQEEQKEQKEQCEYENYGISCLSIEDCYAWMKKTGVPQADIDNARKEDSFKCE